MREWEGCSGKVIHSILLMPHPSISHCDRCLNCCVERELELRRKDCAILGCLKGISCAYIRCLKMWSLIKCWLTFDRQILSHSVAHMILNNNVFQVSVKQVVLYFKDTGPIVPGLQERGN